MTSHRNAKCALLLYCLCLPYLSGCVTSRPPVVLHASEQFLWDRRMNVETNQVPWKITGVNDPAIIRDMLKYINEVEAELAKCRARTP